MAISSKEAADTTTTRATSAANNSLDGIATTLFKSITLKDLPHLTNYLPNLQTRPNPLDQNPFFHTVDGFYLNQYDVVLRQVAYDLSGTFPSPPSQHFSYLRAGQRKDVYFDPSKVRAAIVTCGGLCPGLNTVIRELMVGLWGLYGVRHIFGVTAGYRGFYFREPIELNPKLVHDWHKRGGTVLETSRGGFDLDKIGDAIQNRGFNQVVAWKRISKQIVPFYNKNA